MTDVREENIQTSSHVTQLNVLVFDTKRIFFLVFRLFETQKLEKFN